jgi:GAF domain-containing protein/ANTAR domain-containing protein
VTVRRLEPEVFAQAVATRAEERDRDPISGLCCASAEVLGVAGAGLMLMSGGRSLGCVGASDGFTEAVELVEYTVGEGPCVAAYRTEAPVFDADLADGGTTRWPEFRRGALVAGARAAFGFPLLVHRVCIGALNLYHHESGRLTDDQVADALVVAQVAGRTVLTWQADAPPGTVAWQLEQAPNHRVEVHQATGRISVQAGISLDDALVVLRAYAFSHDLPIGDVAAEVAAGRLRLD